MQNREKILALFLGVVVGGWGTTSVVQSVILGPIEELKGQREFLTGSLSSKEDEELAALRSERMLRDATSRSLPSDPVSATRLYHHWLREMAEAVGFEGVDVDPERNTLKRGEAFYPIRVGITARAQLNQVVDFLYRFYRADLIHGIPRLDLESTDNQGNPILRVSMTVEGLALQGAENRSTLFSETTLAKPLAADATEMEVTSNDGFPEATPFQVRVGYEFMEVTAVNGAIWTLERSQRGRAYRDPAEFPEESVVEWLPMNAEYADRDWTEFVNVISRNPFARYEPSLNSIDDANVLAGGRLDLSTQLVGFDFLRGKTSVVLSGDLPPGLPEPIVEPDLSDGSAWLRFEWDVPQDIETRSYTVAVKLRQGASRIPLFATSDEFQLTIGTPPPDNDSPYFGTLPTLQTYAGQEITAKIAAADRDGHALTYSLQNAPAGATIDATSGEFRWTPLISIVPGAYTVTVRVTDALGGSDSETLNLTVLDDVAPFTFLVGCVLKDDDRRALLYDRSANTQIVVRERQRFRYAGIDGTITEIGLRSLSLRNDKGLWQLDVGKSLSMLDQIGAPYEEPVEDDATPADGDGENSAENVGDSTETGTVAADGEPEKTEPENNGSEDEPASAPSNEPGSEPTTEPTNDPSTESGEKPATEPSDPEDEPANESGDTPTSEAEPGTE